MSDDENDYFFLKLDSPLNLRNFKTVERFHDAQLVIGDETFNVNRIVLASQSSYFEKLFNESSNEDKVFVLEEEWLNPEVMKTLLDFMYSHEISFTSENVQSIFLASYNLDMNRLIKVAERYMGSHISLENCISLFRLSIKHKLVALKRKTLNFIQFNSQEMFQKPFIQELSYEEVVVMLEKFENCKEKSFKPLLFHFIIHWIEGDKDNRMSCLEDLMEAIPYHRLSNHFLATKVAFNHIVFECKPFLYKLFKLFSKKIEDPKDNSEDKEFKLLSFCEKNEDHGRKRVQIIDVLAKTVKVRSISFSISDFGFCSFGSKIYFAGGKEEDGTMVKDLKIFDCIKWKWERTEFMPMGRSNCAVAFLNDYFYVTGGLDENDTQLSSVIRYCSTTKTWSSVAQMLNPKSNHHLISAYGSLYAISGENIEEFVPEMNEWKIVYDFEENSSWTSAAKDCDKIFLILDQTFGIFEIAAKKFQFISEIPPKSHVVTVDDETYLIFKDGSVREIVDDIPSGVDLPKLKVDGQFFTACELN